MARRVGIACTETTLLMFGKFSCGKSSDRVYLGPFLRSSVPAIPSCSQLLEYRNVFYKKAVHYGAMSRSKELQASSLPTRSYAQRKTPWTAIHTYKFLCSVLDNCFFIAATDRGLFKFQVELAARDEQCFSPLETPRCANTRAWFVNCTPDR